MKTIEEKKDYLKNWSINNREKLLKYRLDNKEKAKIYRDNPINKERKKILSSLYNEKNKNKRKEYSIKYHSENKEKMHSKKNKKNV